jgi:hypothetical protein
MIEITQETREQVATIMAAQVLDRKMSPAAAARLQVQNEIDRQRKNADRDFAKKFATLLHDERLIVLLSRISGEKWGERNLLKLRRCLANGWKATCPHDVVFFARLTRDEETISSEQFYNAMTHDWPTPPKAEVKMSDCRAGKQCKWLSRRKPRQAPEGQFCSDLCRQSFIAVQKRAKAGVRSVVN